MASSLPANVGDEEVLTTVDRWAELLAQQRFEAAMELVPSPFDQTRDRLRDFVSPCDTSQSVAGRTLRVAPLARARQAGRRRLVERFGPEFKGTVGMVHYDLDLEGSWGPGMAAGDWGRRLAAVISLSDLGDSRALELLDVELEALYIPTVQDSIAQQFRRPGPLWLPRLTDYDPTVYGVSLRDDGGFFRKHIIVDVFVAGTFLEAPRLPHGGSVGFFASDQVNLRYLNRRHWRNLERVLRAEARPLGEADPYILAEICTSALLQAGNYSHVVLRTPDDIKVAPGPMVSSRLNEREFARVSRLVEAPAISGDAQSGWLLRFWTMHGWMHKKKSLTYQEIRFTPDFAVRHRQRHVSSRIFSLLVGPKY